MRLDRHSFKTRRLSLAIGLSTSSHSSVLIRVVQDSAFLQIPQPPLQVELDEPPPSIQELTKALEQMKSCKAAGVDGIPPEFWKSGGPVLHNRLRELLGCCWEQGKLPGDLRDAVIITLYKNKGGKSDCSNYRGITWLYIAGKVFARVLLNRQGPTIIEDHLPEPQCGFRANRTAPQTWFSCCRLFR